MFFNITYNFKSFSFWFRPIKPANYIINRFISGKSTVEQNRLQTLLQRQIQQEHKYLLPYLYITQSPGKLISTKLIDGFNKWLEVPEDKIHQIKDLCQTLHHSTVLIDDILDESTMRRDIPTANVIFSQANTFNAANLICFLILSAARQLGHPDVPHVIIENLLKCYRGQAMELQWSENLYIPTLEEYKECVLHKTTCAYNIPVNLVELFSKFKYDFVPLMNAFTIYLQIRDDYNDLIGTDQTTSSDDITTGRYTYLTIHAFRNHLDDYQIKRILQLRSKNNNVKKHLISLLDKYGTLEHTRVLLQELEIKFRNEIHKLGGNSELEEVADYLSSTGNYKN